MSNKLLEGVKQALIEDKVLTEEELKTVERDANRSQESLGRALVKSGYLSHERLSVFIAKRLQLPHVDLKKYTIDSKVLDLIPEKIAHRCNIIPLFLLEDVLTVATSDPLNVVAMDELSAVTGYKVEPVLAAPESIQNAITQWYGVGDARKELIAQLSGELKRVERVVPARALDDAALRELRAKSEDKEVVQTVNSLIVQAIIENATDIHLEPKKKSLDVRFRIDGVLFSRLELPQRQVLPICTRVKLMAGLDISKGSVPQDGWATLTIRNQLVDIQVSVFPTLHGEKIVLGITNKAHDVPALAELGFSSQNLSEFQGVIKDKQGLILIGGPNGSGKTTTVYSALKSLVSAEKNIVTLEDPIESEIEGVFQGQVDTKGGVTFAEGLNTILHQDPDVIYIGQIRDFETCGLAIRAALTGHLVFSTMHANNSFETISQLYDMGINPGLLESVLTCSISQRLVRKICPRCKTEYKPLEKTLTELGLPPGTMFTRGEGCQYCSDSGYKGVTGIFEVLVVTKEIRKLISNFMGDEEIMDAAWSAGMKSLFEDGLNKVVRGITSIDELKRVLYPHFTGQQLQKDPLAQAP